ncbi:MAG: NACHT domain-containing protein, partial [Actinobacteria bacterium]|nr:NACHT domain-containing protein [Actinomycetota bacterium]
MSVCIVQGPSGSGKTTLMRSWAAQSGERLTWVALGDGEITRQAFWRHVVGSARRLGDLTPDAAERVIEQLTAAADPVRIATDLLRDAGPVTLVFDAYEHLGDVAPEIDEDLARLVHALPDLRLFITTRGHTSLTDIDPPHGVVRIVSMRELAMSTDEISDLMVTQTGINDHRLAQTISEATHGFALTVRAIVLALSQLGRVPRVNSTEWDSIVAARWEALLPDPSALAFVIATSVPPYLDLELAGALSGHPDPTSTFAALERNGFGRWIPYRRQSPVFQYAETIRATFRAKAMAEPERFAALCSLTAQWLLKGDEPDQALTFAIEGGDLAFADRAFVALVIGNPDSYISDRFLPTLQRVPEERLPDYPMLAFGLGLALAANPMLRLDAPRVFQMAVDSTAAPAYVEPS